MHIPYDSPGTASTGLAEIDAPHELRPSISMPTSCTPPTIYRLTGLIHARPSWQKQIEELSGW